MSPTESKGTLVARYPLKRVKIIKRTLNAFLWFMILGIFLVIAAAVIKPLLAVLILMALAALFAVLYAYNVFYYRNYFYDLTSDGLVIGKGVISSWRITVPAHKIQDVYLDQDLLDRIFGLYDLHLSTPTEASEREAHIDGLCKDDAEAVRSLFLNWLTGKGMVGRIETASSEAGAFFTPARIGLSESIASKSLGTIILLLWVAGLYGLIAAVVVVPIVIVYAYLDYGAIRYSMRRDGILVRRGFFIPKESIFLYRNIQDVEDMQNLMDRIFGTHTLVIKTMTAASAVNAQMIYLPADKSKELREDILRRCKSSAAEAEETAHSRQETTNKAASKPKSETHDIKTLQSPYKNFFMTSAYYNTAVTVAVFIALSLGVTALLAPMGLLGAALGSIMVAIIAGLILAVVVAGIFINAAISSISYTYEIASEYAQIQIRFITTTRRQMLYRKIQDIEKHVSFANSFAHLANLKLETGSKEVIQSGRNQSVASATVANEIIPALRDEDGEKLKLLVTSQMGISLKGLGASPLIEYLPLSAKKPLKKALWWAIFSVILTVACALAAAIFSVTQMLTLGVFIICAVATVVKYLYEIEYLKRYHYDVNDDVIVIKKGVFGSRELTIPYSKIQDVYVNRDLLDLIFGLYDVHISTTTSRSLLNAHIDGLEQVNAEAAALLLVDRIAESK